MSMWRNTTKKTHRPDNNTIKRAHRQRKFNKHYERNPHTKEICRIEKIYPPLYRTTNSIPI